MAKAAVSDDELQLKKRARRRLVGAVALVLLIVVFLPMILDSEPKPLNQDISITIPPVPKPEVAPPISAPTPATPAPAAPHVAGMPEGPAPVQPESAPAVEPRAATPKNATPRPEVRTAPKPAPKTEAKPAASDDSFVVQLGAFSNAANARALQKKLQDNKFKAYTELVKSAAGDRTRVRVGPYTTREAAEKARDRMKSMKLIIGEAAVVHRD
ncbi:MAG TPA: SPOR domain-containing protein [Burkholderiales bacterium]